MSYKKSHSRPSRALAVALGLTLCYTVPLSSVQAGMLDNNQLAAQHQSSQQRAELNTLLARAEVANYLHSQGVDAADLQGRLAALSDTEISQMHAQLDQLPAGEGFLGAVLVIIVIFLLLDMGGVTDVFPNV